MYPSHLQQLSGWISKMKDVKLRSGDNNWDVRHIYWKACWFIGLNARRFLPSHEAKHG